MRTDKEIVYDTILLINALKHILGVRPAHTLFRELKRQMRSISVANMQEIIDELKSEKRILAGDTLNDRYYRTRRFTEEQIMEHFEIAIKTFLEEKAKTDSALAERLKLKTKSMQECCKYIIQQVQKKAKQKYAVCTDEEVYGLAIHYWDEDDIKLEATTTKCDVVTPKKLTPEEKKQAEELKKQREVAAEAERKSRQEEAARRRAEEAKRKKEEEAKAKRLKVQQEGLLFLFDDEEE